MKFPKVSIITVHLDNLDGLKKTRESVIQQSYPGQIEHVVVDGGSAAPVIDYLKREEEGGSFVFISETDNGVYYAMNKGIHVASGEVFWWLNAGDYFADNSAVVTAISAMTKPAEEWGFGITKLISTSGQFDSLAYPVPYSKISHRIGSTFVPHPSSFIGKNIVRQIGGFDTRIRVSADQVFLYRAASIALPITVASILTVFETGGLSSSISAFGIHKEMQNGSKNAGIRAQFGFSGHLLGLVEATLRGAANRIRRRLIKIESR